jgi:predicted regulator of amino acid metabolism with ACT domain
MQSGTILTLMIVQVQTQTVKTEINRIANASQLVVIFVHIKKVKKQKNCMLLNAEVIQIISTRKNAGVIATKLVVLIGQISQYPSLKATAEREVSAPVETAN